jgi:hypothetical protein
MRTTLAVSFCLVLLLGVSCSSKSTDEENKGGNGGILPSAGSTSAGSGGTSATAGTGGAAAVGTAGTSAAQACIDTPLSCVDSETITGCDPDTLMNVTKDCGELVQQLGEGLTSQGCQVVQGRTVCAYDFADMKCADAAAAFTVCYNAATGDNQDMTVFYVDCFTESNYDLADTGQPPMLVNAKTLIECFSDYVSGTTVDCNAAVDACFPAGDMPGAGGAGGAGG